MFCHYYIHGLCYTTKNKNPLHVRAHSCYRMCATECNAEVGGSVLHSVAHIPVQNVYMPVTDMYTYWLRGSSVWLQAAALLLAFLLVSLFILIMGRGSRPICRVGPKTPQNKMAATVG